MRQSLTLWLRQALLSLCLLQLTLSPALAHGEEEGLLEEPLVRVGLSEGQVRVTVAISGGTGLIQDAETGRELGNVSAGQSLECSASGSQVRCGKWTATALRLLPEGTGSYVFFNGQTWRGDLELRSWQGKLFVVNRCRLDDYLYGVVPGEMPSNWHPEALKAQAVAARTYAVRQLGQYAGSHGLYDLRADIFDQVYKGMKQERPSTNRAIDATSGLIMTFDAEPIVAYYHSQSGEATINGTAMKGPKTAYPYLRGVPSRETGFRRWVVDSTPAELKRVLESKGGYKLGAITEFGPHPEDSGYVVVVHTEGLLEVPRNYLRGFYGRDRFQSPNFVIEITPPPSADDRQPLSASTKIRFVGTGWGHGVGMSQHGALGYAEAGWDYRQILTHYYTGTELSIWFDMSLAHED